MKDELGMVKLPLLGGFYSQGSKMAVRKGQSNGHIAVGRKEHRKRWGQGVGRPHQVGRPGRWASWQPPFSYVFPNG